MPDAAPPLLLGTYTTPPFRYSEAVMDEVRDEVVITGLTPARIPRPVGKCPRPRGEARAPRRDLAPWELTRLGEFSDNEGAGRTGRSHASVAPMRRKKGIEPADR